MPPTDTSCHPGAPASHPQGHHGGQAQSAELFSERSLLSGRTSWLSACKIVHPAGPTESPGGPGGHPLSKRAWGLLAEEGAGLWPREAPLPTPVLCPVCRLLSPSSRGAGRRGAGGPGSPPCADKPMNVRGAQGCRLPSTTHPCARLTPHLLQGVAEAAPFSGLTGTRPGPGGALLMSSRHQKPPVGPRTL